MYRSMLRLNNRQTGSTPPGRSQIAALPTKLAKNHRQPLDTPNDQGIQARNALPSSLQPLSSIQTGQQRKVRGTGRGDIQAPAKGSSQCSEGSAGPVSEPNIFSSQVRWDLASGHQSSGAKHTHSPPPFQDGGDTDSEGPNAVGGLAGKTGFERRIPLSPSGSRAQTLAKIPMAESDLSIRYPPIWLKQRSICLHQTAEASSCRSQTGRNQIGPIPGRHDRHGQICTRGPDTPCLGDAHFNSPRLHSEPKEECTCSGTKARILGIPPGLTHNDDLSPMFQDPDYTVSCRGDQGSGSSLSTEALSASRDVGVNSSGSPSGPPLLQTAGESQDSEFEEHPILRDDGDSIRGDEEGPVMVAQRSPKAQRQVNADHSMGHNDRVRCIDARMGSKLQQHQHGRFMVDRGEPTAHQLSRAAGNLLSSEDICLNHTESGNSAENRQCHSNGLLEQNGGNPLNATLRAGSTNMEMVLREKHFHSCRAPPRQREHKSRLAIQACVRLQRLEAPTFSFSSATEQSWSIFNRPFRLPNEHPAAYILQLETGSVSNGNRCTLNLMEGPSSLSVSPVCSFKPLLSEDKQGRGGCRDNCPSMVQANMVPTSITELEGDTDPTTQHSRHNPGTQRRTTPPCPTGASATSRVACVRESLGSKGLSDRVVSIMQKSWRGATENAYSSVWRRWSSWCAVWEADPISAPLNLVLEFLTDLYDEGKQYRTINTARSAISMTHDEVDGFKVGQHPLTIRFFRGIFNSRPPAPRYSETWDVDKVLVYIQNLPDNSQLSLQSLTHKLAMLFALSNADRCSELASLDLRFRSVTREGVRFVIPGLTKTRRSGPPKDAFYPSFTEDRRLCPVVTLKAYEQRTNEVRSKTDRTPQLLFISVRRPYTPVKPATIGHWIQKVMTQAGIDTKIFSAHSTRGASTSKARRAGVSVPEILKAADWGSVSTFRRFYHRPVQDNDFGRKVLRCTQSRGKL